MGLLSTQPFRSLYIVYFIATFLPRAMLLSLYYVPLFLRPNQKWSQSRSLRSALFHSFIAFASLIEMQSSKTLSPGPAKERFITIPPAPTSVLSGPAVSDPQVQPATIGGMWYPMRYDPKLHRDRKVALSFHGGAYVMGGVRPLEGGWGPELLARHLGGDSTKKPDLSNDPEAYSGGFTLMPQYRLAWQSEHGPSRFPASLQDAISAYVYLVQTLRVALQTSSSPAI